MKKTFGEFQAKNRQKFKNTQAEFKKAVSYKKKVYSRLARSVLQLRHYMHVYLFIPSLPELHTSD